MRCLAVFALLVASALAEQTRYDGYQVFEVMARDNVAFKAMVHLFKSGNYDFWREPRGLDDAMDVMVPPAFNTAFVEVLQTFNMEYRIKIADVQELIEESKKDIAPAIVQPRGIRHGRNGSPKYALTWDAFYDLPAIYEFVNAIAAANPNLVKVRSGGLSYEGRDMPIVTISKGGSGKNVIFVDGGIHAREWLSPAFTTWLIHELVENDSAHPEFTSNVDWVIMPMVNPDGYAWTHNTSGDRMWRKNRAPHPISNCLGTDLNRNFDFHYDEGGSSELGCTQTTNGAGPFSEPESRNIRDAVLSVANRTKIYLTFHTYGQYFLYPWGYTTELPADWQELDRLANKSAAALKAVSGTSYVVGSSTNTLSVGSGGSDDWAKGAANITYSYTPEMRDTGNYGFIAPATEIMPNNREMWEAVKVFAANFFN